MAGFLLGVVVGVLINLVTALFSRKHALQLIPWMTLYIFIHGMLVLLQTDTAWGISLSISRRFTSNFSYVFVILLFAIAGGVFWHFVRKATNNLANATQPGSHEVPSVPSRPLATETAPDASEKPIQQASKSTHPRPAAPAPYIPKPPENIPEITAEFVQATSPGIILTNRSSAVARDPSCSISAWNLSKSPPLALPTFNQNDPGQFIKPGGGADPRQPR